MRKLFTKLLAFLPKDSDGLELAEYGITWEIFKLDSGSPMLRIRWGGLEIYVMIDSDKPRYNIKDEMTKQAGSFEEIAFRAVLAAQHSKYVHMGDLGTLGVVRYVLYKDLVTIINEIIDAENLSEGSERSSVKSNAVGTICRKVFHFPVHRTGHGWVVVLDGDKIEECGLRYGFEE